MAHPNSEKELKNIRSSQQTVGESASYLAPVQASRPLITQTTKLAPVLPTDATTTPGDEKIPEPTCIPTTRPIA